MTHDRGEIERAMETARRAVEAGSAASLRHWRTGLEVALKADRSPVTAADRESEAAILAVLQAAYPELPVLAEESGLVGGSAPRGGAAQPKTQPQAAERDEFTSARAAGGLGGAAQPPPDSMWIVDPLDGTRGFARGGAFWGPLVGLQHEGSMVAGAAALPALGETYWAGQGLGAYRNGERLAVSTISAWHEATLSVGELKGLLSGPAMRAVATLIAEAASARCYGDLAGCLMLLDGWAEAWLESGVKPWDLAALKILVEEAGGRFTDFEGTSSLASGRAVATNGRLHDHVLNALARG